MAIYTGRDGILKFDGDVQGKVKSWTLEASLAMLDITELGFDTVENVAGLKSYSGSATILYHNDNNALANVLDNIFTDGVPTRANLEFIWGTKTIKFLAFVTGASLSMAAGELMTADITFTNAGDVFAVTL